MKTLRHALPLLALLPLAATACGSSDSASGGAGPAPVEVTAAFYPLQWITEQVGGDDVEVSSLTPPGAEPHDLELSPKQVGQVGEADLVVKLAGFQPAVDDATAEGANVFEVADVVDLDLTTAEDGHDHGEGEEDEHAEGDEHAEEAAGDEAIDPHFWLDPTLLAEVAPAIAERLGTIDPENAEDYEARAKEVVSRLDRIDADFEGGLAECDSTDLVTSHQAFGYLARRYGLTQVGIAGFSPEQEPSPSRLAEVADFVEEHGVTTIYFETLVPSDLAQTLADETGASASVLDPIEGVTDESAGDDYPEIMAANLASLREGQGCR